MMSIMYNIWGRVKNSSYLWIQSYFPAIFWFRVTVVKKLKIVQFDICPSKQNYEWSNWKFVALNYMFLRSGIWKWS